MPTTGPNTLRVLCSAFSNEQPPQLPLLWRPSEMFLDRKLALGTDKPSLLFKNVDIFCGLGELKCENKHLSGLQKKLNLLSLLDSELFS